MMVWELGIPGKQGVSSHRPTTKDQGKNWRIRQIGKEEYTRF